MSRLAQALLAIIITCVLPASCARHVAPQHTDMTDLTRLELSRIELGSMPQLCETLEGEEELPTDEWRRRLPRSYHAEIDTTEFTLSLDSGGRVLLVGTSDPSFQTPEGVQIGWSRHRLETTFQDSVECPPSGPCFLQLSSGWEAVFLKTLVVSGNPLDNRYEAPVPEPEDSITILAQRRTCGDQPDN